MKYFSIARIEDVGVEEFEGEPHPRVPKCIMHGNTAEVLGKVCFKTRRKAAAAGREWLTLRIEEAVFRKDWLEARLKELA